jgi:hypothetical protein
MDPLVFRAALRASARVAFTAALVGCGGTVISGGTADPDHGTDMGTPTDEASTGPDVATNTEAGTEAGTSLEGGTGFEAGQVQEAAIPGDSGLACNAPPPSSLFHTGVPASSVNASMFDCCMAELTPLIATDSGTDSADAAAADPNVAGCCGVVVFAVNHDTGPDASAQATAEVAAFDELGWGARSLCCSLLKWPGGGTTCEAWGPPTPPAMPGEADLAAFDERQVA